MVRQETSLTSTGSLLQGTCTTSPHQPHLHQAAGQVAGDVFPEADDGHLLEYDASEHDAGDLPERLEEVPQDGVLLVGGRQLHRLDQDLVARGEGREIEGVQVDVDEAASHLHHHVPAPPRLRHAAEGDQAGGLVSAGEGGGHCVPKAGELGRDILCRKVEGGAPLDGEAQRGDAADLLLNPRHQGPCEGLRRRHHAVLAAASTVAQDLCQDL